MNNKLYEEIMTNISKQVKKLIRENEYWDEPFRDDENEISIITKDELPILSNSEIDKFNFVSDNLLQIAKESNAETYSECVNIVIKQIEDILFNTFEEIPSYEQILSYIVDDRGLGYDWSSIEKQGYNNLDEIHDVYFELACKAVNDTHKYE